LSGVAGYPGSRWWRSTRAKRAGALEAHKDQAIEIQSEEVYERYIKCLTGCAKMFRVGYIDVNQFTLTKVAASVLTCDN
jgi:cyclopropane fatty-acyl-phospholipid synthase-like methyltransferase